jgi:hypothetical protein
MFRNMCVAVVLILLCTAGAASALQLDPETAAAAERAGLLDGLWEKLLDWIDRMARGEDGGLRALEMDTCHLDPNGVCGGS